MYGMKSIVVVIFTRDKAHFHENQFSHLKKEMFAAPDCN